MGALTNIYGLYLLPHSQEAYTFERIATAFANMRRMKKMSESCSVRNQHWQVFSRVK